MFFLSKFLFQVRTRETKLLLKFLRRPENIGRKKNVASSWGKIGIVFTPAQEGRGGNIVLGGENFQKKAQ